MLALLLSVMGELGYGVATVTAVNLELEAISERAWETDPDDPCFLPTVYGDCIGACNECPHEPDPYATGVCPTDCEYDCAMCPLYDKGITL